MKLKLSVAFLLISLFVNAGQVKLAWDYSCDSAVAGYKVYYGFSDTNLPPAATGSMYYPCLGKSMPMIFFSNNFTSVVDAGQTNFITLTNLIEGKYYFFAATTYDAYGLESDFSSQAIYRVPLTYTNGGPLPVVSMAPADYQTNWFASPIISTNKNTGQISTNYFSLKIRTFRFQDDLVIPTSWTVLQSTNLASTNWFYYASGTNSLIDLVITNNGDNRFFKLKF